MQYGWIRVAPECLGTEVQPSRFAVGARVEWRFRAGSGLTVARHGGSYDTVEAAIPATARKLLGVLNRMIADETYL